jgi:AraC-like DNA-binding protein
MSDLPDILTWANDYPRGHVIGLHAHDYCQLVFARRGAMRVVAQGGVWVVPPGRALWMPAREPHEVHCRTDVAMRTVYISDQVALPFVKSFAVLGISTLMRELIVRLVEGPVGEDTQPHLLSLLIAELWTGPVMPLNLQEPSDPRLSRVTARLIQDPADRRDLDAWAGEAGMARRSFARRFSQETGLSFGAWRRRLRLLGAIEKLAAGEPVTSVALEAGYDSTSAFIHAFRREFGVTPGRYFGGDA